MKRPSFAPPLDAARSALMRRVRQRGTGAEDQVAQVLRGLGVFYRRNVRSLPGSPDFANKSRHWTLFVHGCFWHRHKDCPRATTPKHNRPFWLDKFASNQERDRGKARLLRSLGLRVVTVWECETEDENRLSRRLKRALGAA